MPLVINKILLKEGEPYGQGKPGIKVNTVYTTLYKEEMKEKIYSAQTKVRAGSLIHCKKRRRSITYGYCIMDNHVHLIINDNGNDISKMIKSINISYAFYLNYVNNRCGHLFQDRFLSEMITEDAYLLQVSKYIHKKEVVNSYLQNSRHWKK